MKTITIGGVKSNRTDIEKFIKQASEIELLREITLLLLELVGKKN